MDEKTQAILKIFLRFPSILVLPEAEKQGMTAAYLDDCRGLTADEITAGYERFRRKGSPFAPSGPELRAASFEARADRMQAERNTVIHAATRNVLARGIHSVPEADRESVKQRFAELLASLRNGTAQ